MSARAVFDRSAWLRRLFVAALVPLLAPAAAAAGEAVLRLRDSGIEIAGTVRGFDGHSYAIETPAFGLLRLEAARFSCTGPGCDPARVEPAAVDVSAPAGATVAVDSAGLPEPAAIMIAGSATMGAELMPALVRGWAAGRAATTRQLLGGDASAIRLRVADARGRPAASVAIANTGSDAGLAALGHGHAVLALSSRPATDAEAGQIAHQSAAQATGSDVHIVALDGLAVIVAPGNPAGALAIDAIVGIFSGRITDWSALGLPARPITVYWREGSASASQRLADTLLAPRGLARTPSARTLESDGALADAVAADPGGIGVTSFATLVNARAIAIRHACGLIASPTPFAVKAEEYPLSRRLYLYSTAADASLARDLATYTASAPAQTIIRASDFVDQSIEIEPAELAAARRTSTLDPGVSGAAARAQQRLFRAERQSARRLSTTFRFASGSSRLDAKALHDVQRLVAFARAPGQRGKTLVFAGFTDAAGSPAVNAALAARRALQVRSAVLAAARGPVPFVATQVRGFGAVAPVACNSEGADKLLNRRVEVWLR